MAANTSPIYSLTPKINGVAVSALLATSDGSSGTIGTNIFLAYTAGTNGSYISVLRWSAVGTSSPTNTIATVGRVYVSTISSGSTNNGNTWLFAEYSLDVQAADHSTNATFFIEVPIYKALPGGYTILVSNSASPASNAYWQAVVYGGDY